MPAKTFPACPSLEQYKKQAKELVKACGNAVPEALERVRLHHPRWRGSALDIPRASFKLSDAQLIIAREHAFDSWSQFSQSIRLFNSSTERSSYSECVSVDGIELTAEVTGWKRASALVLFAHASGSRRFYPANRYIAEEFERASLATVQADLLTEEEELSDRTADKLRFDLRLLSRRISAIAGWIERQPGLQGLPLGYMGSGTGAAAALLAAAEHPGSVRAIVSAEGRPDLAGPWIWQVRAPLLFIVGRKDTVGLGFTTPFVAPLPNVAGRSLAVVQGAHQLFADKDALRRTAAYTKRWFWRHLAGPQGANHES